MKVEAVGTITITLTSQELKNIKCNLALREEESCFKIHSRTAAELLQKIVELDI